MRERARRLPSFFREVNDEIMRLTAEMRRRDGLITLLCECGSPACHTQLQVTPAEYEAARRGGSPLVADGHEDGA
jgi:hypothetical protein